MTGRMPRRHATSALACLLASTALMAGCGSDSDSSTSGQGVAANVPAPPKSEFPKTEGRTLRELVKAADSHAELVVSPAALVFQEGRNRYPFGVFHPDRSQLADATAALYVARVPAVEAGGGGG